MANPSTFENLSFDLNSLSKISNDSHNGSKFLSLHVQRKVVTSLTVLCFLLSKSGLGVKNIGAVYNIEMQHTLLDQWTSMVGIFYRKVCNSLTTTSYCCGRVRVFILLCVSLEES